jgi:hypothetical protein
MSTLYVDNIYSKTGTAQALTIDSSGRIFTPQRPAFYIRKTGTTYTYGTSPIPWDDVVFDTANAWNSSSYRYECPVAGLYWVNISVHNTTNQITSAFVRKSGGNYLFGFNANTAGNTEGNLVISALMECTASDYIDAVGDRSTSAGFFGGLSAMQVMFMG